jgi:hypothetical protein
LGTRTVAVNFFRVRMASSPISSSYRLRRSLRWECTSSCTYTSGHCVPWLCEYTVSSESRIRCWDGSRCSLVQSCSAGIVVTVPFRSVSHIISWCVSHNKIPSPLGGLSGRKERVPLTFFHFLLSCDIRLGWRLYRIWCHPSDPAPRGGCMGSQERT